MSCCGCTHRETVMTPDPRSGEDTFDLIDDAVAALADRRGVWLGDELSTIALIASLNEQAERWLPELLVSRGTSISAGPISVNTVLARVPLRELPLPRPDGSCLS